MESGSPRMAFCLRPSPKVGVKMSDLGMQQKMAAVLALAAQSENELRDGY